MNKRGDLQNILVGSVLFIAILSGIIIMFSLQQEYYSYNADEKFIGDNYNQSVNDTAELTREISSTFKTSNTDQSSLDASLTGGLNAIKKSFGMFDIVNSVLNRLIKIFRIPEWIWAPGLSILLLIFAIAVIQAFTARFLAK